MPVKLANLLYHRDRAGGPGSGDRPEAVVARNTWYDTRRANHEQIIYAIPAERERP